MTHTRTASRQAWRRLRRTVTDGELRDIARDLANVVMAENGLASAERDDLAVSLTYGLTAFPWDEKRQS